MVRRAGWRWIAAATVAMGLLIGSAANPSSQPQRVSDIVARLTTLEETVSAQADTIAALEARVTALEGGPSAPPVNAAPELTIPAAWDRYFSSDGLISYWADPAWDLTKDEPGILDFWVDDDLAGITFAFDFPPDMMDELLSDARLLEFFEEELLGNSDDVQAEIEDSGRRPFLDGEAFYWDVTLDDGAGLAGRFIFVFYACSEKASCGLTHYRLVDTRRADDAVWALMETFATGVDFLSAGKITVHANANLRACPSITCDIVGRVLSGEIIEVIGQSPDGQWIKLRSGEWIAASLVDDAPADLPILESLPGL